MNSLITCWLSSPAQDLGSKAIKCKIQLAKLIYDAAAGSELIILLLGTFFLQDGWSPLMTACNKGYSQVVEVLLHGGAHPDLQSKVRQQYQI